MGDVGNEIVKMLHSFCKLANLPMKISILSMMFELLRNFAAQKNKFAPVLYKSLTYILIENHNDDVVRMHILQDFKSLFSSSGTIPIGIVLEPFVKQFMVSDGESFQHEVFDFDLFECAATHPKLEVLLAISLLDLLAKVFINDEVYAKTAERIILKLI